MKLSIQTVLLVTLVGSQLIAGTLALLWSSMESDRAILDQSRKIIVERARSVAHHAEHVLQPAEAMLDLVAMQLSESRFDLEEMPRLLHHALSVSENASGIFVGDINGNFVFVSRWEDEKGAFRTKLIDASDGESGASLRWHDSGFETLSTVFDETDRFDPRSRPWFEAAVASEGDTVWTDPYVFFSRRVPGVTAAKPVVGADGAVLGVVGVDLDLETMSGFLGGLYPDGGGASFILGANGDVIAHSDLGAETLLRHDGTSGLQLAQLDALVDGAALAATQEATERSGSGAERIAFFEFDGAGYTAVAMPISVGGAGWVVVNYQSELQLLHIVYGAHNRGIALIFGTALLTALLGTIVVQSVTRSLRTFAHQAEALTEGNAPERSGPTSHYREIDDLGRSFDRMTAWLSDYRQKNETLTIALSARSQMLEARVEERTRELSDANVRLTGEVAERSEAQRLLAAEMGEHRLTMRELSIALQEAQGANEAKSRFLAGVSHELRTPLNAIVGFAQMLGGSGIELCEEKRREYADYILQSGQRLSRLINQVIDHASADSGSLSVEMGTVDTSHALAEAVNELSLLAENRGIELTNDAIGALPEISGDPDRCVQVFVNLVSNAIKYNRDGGTVRVAAQVCDASVRITVNDTGIGIPAERQAQVFEMFNRLGRSASDVDGNGIGLALTRDLVNRMGGSIGFESVEGEGSSFWVSFPRADVGSSEAVSPTNCAA